MKVRSALFLIVGLGYGFTGNVFGQASALDFERLRPRGAEREALPAQLPTTESLNLPQEEVVILKSLKALVLVTEEPFERPSGPLSGVIVASDSVVRPDLLQARLTPFIGQPLTFATLDTIRREMITHYRRADRPVVDVRIPEQEVTDGVVTLLIAEGRVGRVFAEGQRWFPEQRLVRSVRSHQGDELIASRLVGDMNWLNRNPFRQSELLFRKGEAYGETDLIIRTKDRLPFRPYIAYDNSGTINSGEDRFSFGFNWGDAFGLDQVLSYQFTMGQDTNLLNAHAATWSIPLPSRHMLTLFGSYATSVNDIQSILFVEQEDLQIGLRYIMPLPSTGRLKHEVFLGADLKQSINTISFQRIPVFDNETWIAQGVFGYEANLVDGWGNSSFTVTGFYSPGDLLDNNADEDFERSRAFGESSYVYGRAVLRRTQRLPWNFHLFAYVSGQISSTNLLRSEQFSIGGATTIRGYDEGVGNGDNGWLASAELRGPALQPLKIFGQEGLKDELRLHLFADIGSVSSVNRLPLEPSTLDLASIGVGLRYRINTHLSLRVDYGWQVGDAVPFGEERSRGHVSVSLSY